jgi:multidrug efflux system membrane fusion protein
MSSRSPHRGHLALASRAVAAVLLLALSGCGGIQKRPSPRVAVTVATVERRDVPVEIGATGTVEPIETAAVGSQVGGVVMRLAFNEGDEVREGQLLVQIDPRPFRAALDQARANLMRDAAQARGARLDAERAEQLFQQNLISAAEHDRAIATGDASEGTLRADSAAVATARLNLEYASIRSPITGRTGNLNVHVGDLVKAATSEPLVTVNRLRPIRVRFTVPQSELPRIQRYRGASPRVIVHPAGDDSVDYVGRLTFVDNAVDAASGTLLLKGEFPNEERRLWPGEFVQVRLVLTTLTNAMVVPATAIANGQQGTYVFVLNADSTASSRPVVVDRSDDVTAVVSHGLEPGETVVTDGQFRLGPGARVLVRKPGAEAGTGAGAGGRR